MNEVKNERNELSSSDRLATVLSAKDGVICSADEYSLTIIVDGICYSISPWGDMRGDAGLSFDHWKSDS